MASRTWSRRCAESYCLYSGAVECEPNQISCQLNRIADEVTGFDFDAFLSTLIATVIGAVIALLGAWILDRRRAKAEARDRYELLLNDALYRFLEEVGERRGVLATADSSPLPSPSTLHAAATVARMVARDADAEATKQMQYAVDRVAKLDSASAQEHQVRIIGQVVRAWRAGSHDAAKAAERFQGLST